MKKHHFFNLFVLLAVAAIVALTVREALAMSAILPAADRTYDSIEQQRAANPAQADRSSDPVELLRSDRLHPISSSRGASKNAEYCLSAGDRTSIRSEFMQWAYAWFPRNSGVPTGVDGGLIQLLSGSRSCNG